MKKRDLIILVIIIFLTQFLFVKSARVATTPSQAVVNFIPELLQPIPDQYWVFNTDNNDAFNLYDYFFDGNDPILTFTVSGNTNINVVIEPGGNVSFTQSLGWHGRETVVFTATDATGDFVDSNLVLLTVFNNAPVLDFIPDQILFEDEPFSYDVNATDIDNDLLTYASNSTFFAIGSGTGIIDFTPIQQDNGRHAVLIIVSDDYSTDSQIVIFDIQPVNDPPILDPIGSLTAIVDEILIYDVNAFDEENDALFFIANHSIINDNLNPATGVITFIPSIAELGTYTVNISVFDFPGAMDFEVISFTVIRANNPPVITDFNPKVIEVTIDEGGLQLFNITKFDPDGTIPSTQWYFDGVVLIGETNDEFLYLPDFDSTGIHNLTVVISDGIATDSHFWRIIVNDVAIPTGPLIFVGGGGGGKRCRENWRCSEWSFCLPSKIQYRQCIDVTDCDTATNRPVDSQSCIYLSEASCFDGKRNQNEVFIDCGGVCGECPTCDDGIKNGFETGIDCGGSCPNICIEIEEPTCRDNICTLSDVYQCPEDCNLSVAIVSVTSILIATILLAFIIFIYINRDKIYVFRAKLHDLFIKKPVLAKDIALGQKTIKALERLRKQVYKEDIQKTVKKLSSILRTFFVEKYHIKYQFTYTQLNTDLKKSKVKDGTRRKIVYSVNVISDVLYGQVIITKKELANLIKNIIILIKSIVLPAGYIIKEEFGIKVVFIKMFRYLFSGVKFKSKKRHT